MRDFSLIMCLVGLLLSCNNSFDNKEYKPLVRLSNESASHEAHALYHSLYETAQQGFLIGHQDAVAYGIGWRDQGFESDIYKVTGDHPSLFGWDLGHIADDVNIDSVPFERMKTWAIEINERGGLNTYGWHAKNLTTGDSSWDKTPSVTDVLPGGKHHELFKERLGFVASFFKALTDSQGNLIPVIFRPWHEMNGSWFWWGAGNCSVEDYKKLWVYTYEYFTQEHQLNNIIWCYSTDAFDSPEEYLIYYPGDDYVDILGFDDYKGVKKAEYFHKTVNRLEILAKLATEKAKIYALSETGSEQIKDPTWFTQLLNGILLKNKETQGAAYILFWRNGRPDHYYVPYPGHPAVDDFVKFYNNPSTIFLKDINQQKVSNNNQ